MTRLTEEQYALFVRKVAVRQCPLCGSDSFRHSRIVTTTQEPPAAKPIAGERFSRLTVTCLSCGLILEFNSSVLGL